MGTNEDYLDSLLKAAMESENKTHVKEPEKAEEIYEPEADVIEAEIEPEADVTAAEIEPELPSSEHVEISAPMTDDDPGRQLTPDEIAAMFAMADTGNADSTDSADSENDGADADRDEKESTKEECVEADSVEAESSDDVFPNALQEEMEIDLDGIDDLDALLGLREVSPERHREGKNDHEEEEIPEIPEDNLPQMQMKEAKEPKESVQEKETEDTSREGLTGLFGENESFEDQDVTALLDLLGDDDSELAEINELLKKSDQNEPVDEDMFAKMAGASGKGETEENSEAPVTGTDEEKQKKGKFKKKRWGKKKKKTDDTPMDEATGPENLTENVTESLSGGLAEGSEGLTGLEGLTDLDGFIETIGNEENAETIGKEKKNGFFGRLFQALTEEVEDDETDEGKKTEGAEGENGEIVPVEKKKKRGKKKKGQKTPETNEEILEEMIQEDQEKAKIKKKKEKKPKKEKKSGQEKQPVIEEPGKKLPKKMVIRIFVLCFSFLAIILLVTLFLPGILQLKNARRQFYSGNYEEAYQALVGQNLGESDKILLQKAEMIVQLQRKANAYEAYKAAGDEPEALNALLEGVSYYWSHDAQYDSLGIRQEAEQAYMHLLVLLETDYSISEEQAKEIIALDSITYTYKIRELTGEEAGQGTADESEQTELMEQTEPVEQTQEPDLKDPLEEELE